MKNSLAVVADLLLLGRPDDPKAARTFDQAGTRIRAIAAVHDVLATRSGGRVPADELLRAVVEAAGPAGTELDAPPVRLTFQQAQHVGVIVNELVTNAYRHGAPPVRVALRERAGGDLELTVRDAGPGPRDARAAGSGGGLGLQLVRQVAEQGLGGQLELGVGGATCASVQSVMRILVAEDDPILALGIARRLEQLGHAVIGPFARGEEVREAARSEAPELLLVDIDLDGADGLEVSAELLAGGLDVPVVVLTASMRPARRALDRLRRAGVPHEAGRRPAARCRDPRRGRASPRTRRAAR